MDWDDTEDYDFLEVVISAKANMTDMSRVERVAHTESIITDLRVSLLLAVMELEESS